MDPEIVHLKSKEDTQFIAPKNNNNNSAKILKNYSESNFFSRLFYFWAKPAIELANKKPLENKDVGNISPSQYTSKMMPEFHEIFNKKSSNKNNKYPLFFSILSLHFKSLLFIFFLFMVDLCLVYTKIFFFKRIISCFSKG